MYDLQRDFLGQLDDVLSVKHVHTPQTPNDSQERCACGYVRKVTIVDGKRLHSDWVCAIASGT